MVQSSGEAVEGRLARAASHLSSGQAGAALAECRAALAEAPDDPRVLRLAGIAAHRARRLDEAEALFRRRLALDESSGEARSDLSNLLLARERPEEVIDLLGGRAGLDEAASFNLGRAYKQVGRTGEAIAPFERVLAVHPGHRGALIALGDACKAVGRIDDAGAHYRRAIEARPDDAVAWWALSNLKARGFDDAEFDRLRSLAGAAPPGPAQAYFEFALARGYEDRGAYDEAFAHYAAGNRARRGEQPWDRRKFSSWLAAVGEAFEGVPVPARPSPLGRPRPVFIVSLPRAGSTLTEQVLAAHPEVTAASELPWVPRLIAAESRRRGKAFAAWAPEATADDWRRLGGEYLERTAWWQRGTRVFTDKLPGNFAYLGAILAMLPDALVVNVRRAPMDVCLSCYRQLFIRGQEFSYDLEDLGHYWRDYDAHTRRWRDRAPDRIHDLVYERLVEDPEGQVRSLLEFLDLPWDERCLRFHEADRAVNTASAAQVRRGINRRGLGYSEKWAKHLEPLRAALGDAAD